MANRNGTVADFLVADRPFAGSDTLEPILMMSGAGPDSPVLLLSGVHGDLLVVDLDRLTEQIDRFGLDPAAPDMYPAGRADEPNPVFGMFRYDFRAVRVSQCNIEGVKCFGDTIRR